MNANARRHAPGCIGPEIAGRYRRRHGVPPYSIAPHVTMGAFLLLHETFACPLAQVVNWFVTARWSGQRLAIPPASRCSKLFHLLNSASWPSGVVKEISRRVAPARLFEAQVKPILQAQPLQCCKGRWRRRINSLNRCCNYGKRCCRLNA
jgi:hypothetical protein